LDAPLQPIVASIHVPATKISKFLDDLLRPIFNSAAKETTYINGIDVVRHVEDNQKKGYLIATTQFITFDVTDLYIMIPKSGALDTLGRFCAKNAKQNKIGNLTIDTILRLARLVLDTNCFLFDNKYYQQVRDGAMGSPLTMTLANISMLECEQSLIERHRTNNELLYGRYV